MIPTITLCLLLAGLSLAAEPACRQPLVQRQRYGFVATVHNWPQQLDVGQLRAGWSVDFVHTDSAPEGMDQALVIRTSTGYTIDPHRLGPLVDAHPGAMWLIGNEPDCIWQDNILPQEYARIYHDLYTFIKSRDQTSQIAAGGIVQPTPLRLEYLDRVLATYQAEYHQPLPLDLWHIHNAILNEERGGWGADIPPGIDATVGAIRTIDDNDNMDIFENQILVFRQWMASNGYAGEPLIVTEFGILMPEMYGFGPPRVNAFMSATFAFLETATDPVLGDPTDGHRLVQRWAWFSLDVQPWDPITGLGFNGNLLDTDTGAITAFGLNYAGHTSAFPPLSYTDLGFAQWQITPASVVISPTQTMTRSIHLKIVNIGTADSGSFDVQLAYDGPQSGTHSLALANLRPGSSEWLTFTLTNLQPGGYTITAEIDPDNRVVESRECNNLLTGALVIPTKAIYLPLTGIHHTPAGKAGDQSRTTGSIEAPAGPEPATAIDSITSTLGFHEFPAPWAPSSPVQIALDRQGGVWISDWDGNKIARLDIGTGHWDQYGIPTPNSRPWGLALDASGNVWFTETAANKIGKLNIASGTISEHPVPTPDSEPWDVAIGSDGTVWFTEKDGNKIGKLAPATGMITEYALPAGDAQPGAIDTHGRYVWFTQTAPDMLGQLDTITGGFLALPRPAGSIPQGLVMTSAGNVWWTEMGANKIVLFAPSTLQRIFEVDVPTAGSQPYGIAMEGNVAVWFTERAGNKLVRVTGAHLTRGLVPVEYPLPTPNSSPTGLAVDNAGCAWYTAPTADRIGRLCLTRLPLPLIVRNRRWQPAADTTEG